jgi:hypothetical protein
MPRPSLETNRSKVAARLERDGTPRQVNPNAILHAFDLLELDGTDCRAEPFAPRAYTGSRGASNEAMRRFVKSTRPDRVGPNKAGARAASA